MKKPLHENSGEVSALPLIQGININRHTYIFLDEAGNLDFGPKGSRYFLLTSVSMQRPFPKVGTLDDYKYDCLEYGLDIEYFHCTSDNKHVRNRIFDLITTDLSGMRLDCIVVDKRKTDLALREDKRFYPEMLGHLLKFALRKELDAGAKEIIVITDSLPIRKKRKAIEKSVQLVLNKMLSPDMKHRMLHHASRSHYGLQMADYCCWAVQRKWEAKDTTYYAKIKPALRSEFNIFRGRREV